MKTAAITSLVLTAGVLVHAQSKGANAERTVTVCMERLDTHASLAVAARARELASQMFAGTGVGIEWRLGLRGCPAQAILISLSYDTPESLKPGALAYALPYEGTHICLFYDRIAQIQCQRLIPIVLAHVLVHEITHLLQGICRHSDSGIMKTRWNQDDFQHMAWKPLAFAAEDVDLIHRGLATRAARASVEMNTSRTAIAAQ
jgi:hypothetical protein